MTIDMTNNRVPYGLLTDEEKAALHEHVKAGGEFEIHAGTSWWPEGNTPWHHKLVLRTVPLPAQRSLLATTNEQLVATNEALTKERDEALNQWDSARHSVDVLEKLVAFVEEERRKTFQALLKVTKIHDDVETKLAKAVEGLRDAVDAWDNHNKTGDMMQGHWVTDARATLAEIENSEAVTLGEKT
jgi:hypothetical protein